MKVQVQNTPARGVNQGETPLFSVMGSNANFPTSSNANFPTRVTTTSKTLIDLILTKIEDTKTIDAAVIHIGISDHSLVYIFRKVSIPKGKPKIIETRQFKHYNEVRFQDDLKQALNTHLHYLYTYPNLAWQNWKEEFLNISKKHVPIRRKRSKVSINLG
jgi:hypothetical protein